MRQKHRLSFSLGQYRTVFQAEVYAIKAHAVQNINNMYKNWNIYNLSDSQAVINTLDKYQTHSQLL
jgi:hypothetical protein